MINSSLAYGINITAATYIFLMEPGWDEAKERQVKLQSLNAPIRYSSSISPQAIKRAHRIGQTKEVFVEKIIMRHSVEEKILALHRDESMNSSTGTSPFTTFLYLLILNIIRFNKRRQRQKTTHEDEIAFKLARDH